MHTVCVIIKVKFVIGIIVVAIGIASPRQTADNEAK